MRAPRETAEPSLRTPAAQIRSCSPRDADGLVSRIGPLAKNFRSSLGVVRTLLLLTFHVSAPHRAMARVRDGESVPIRSGIPNRQRHILADVIAP
jgi:hypothetical protein